VHERNFPRREGYRMLLTVVLTVIVVLVALALIVHFGEPLSLLPVVERRSPSVVYRIKTDHPLAALSFDDGPHPVFTPQVLDILSRHSTRATFFLIGERALRHPELVARIKADGHEVANHYFTNGHTLNDTPEEFLANIEKTDRAIGIAQKPVLYRPPVGWARSWQLKLAREHGYISVLGCAYPRDTLHPPLWYFRWLVQKNLFPGAIVILHDGISNPRQTIRALPDILQIARQKGLRFVSIGELRGFGRN
jgi:peptidoglycan-N-acetylglucosamine deacetylase